MEHLKPLTCFPGFPPQFRSLLTELRPFRTSRTVHPSEERPSNNPRAETEPNFFLFFSFFLGVFFWKIRIRLVCTPSKYLTIVDRCFLFQLGWKISLPSPSPFLRNLQPNPTGKLLNDLAATSFLSLSLSLVFFPFLRSTTTRRFSPRPFCPSLPLEARRVLRAFRFVVSADFLERRGSLRECLREMKVENGVIN